MEDIELVENTEPDNDNNIEKIRHLVISGGGVNILSFYGAIREANKKGVWDISNITSIYGTSAGSMLGVMLLLKYDWDVLDNYIINRPWQNVFKCNMYSIINTFQELGVFDIKVIEEIFLPLFKGKDISIDITMDELFNNTNIDLHMYAVDINNFELVDISHKTCPNWRVIDAVYASCSLPFIFKPFIKDGKYYADGGILVNYPIHQCIKCGANPNEILGISKEVDHSIGGDNIHSESNIFDYLLLILSKMLKKIRLDTVENENIKLKYNIVIYSKYTTLPLIINTASSVEERIAIIETGVRCFDTIYNNSGATATASALC
uniref:PNPLA domain-containing protein n=1 Tax=viral metagenome TaxID=1070528 RepID=A0A6C0DRR2_9ZZZZ